MSMKNPLTPAGIEPANFWFVAQHLNHCATAVPQGNEYTLKIGNSFCFLYRNNGWTNKPQRYMYIACFL